MRFPIDVAFCDRDLAVLSTIRACDATALGAPRLKAHCVLEAEAGAFERWQPCAPATSSK